MLFYTDEHDNYLRIVVSKIGESGLFSIDTEDAKIQKKNVRGYDVIVSSNDGVNILTFSTNTFIYVFETNHIKSKDLIKIMESIEIIK